MYFVSKREQGILISSKRK